MATIGLKDIYISDITEDAEGNETYGVPWKLAPAISADLNLNYERAKLRGDDRVIDEIVRFIDGTLSLGSTGITAENRAKLTGAKVDSNGLLVMSAEDDPPYKAVGFRAPTSDKEEAYLWLYRVKFSPVKESFNTKGDSISFNTPTIEGTVLERNKPDSRGNHPVMTYVKSGESDDSAEAISTWFSAVPPEPTFAQNQGE